MPAPWGLTAAGFSLPRTEDCLAEIREAWSGEFGENTDYSAESPDGQMTTIMADRESSVWEQIENVYNAQNPDSATGAALDEQCARTGVERLPATRSSVTLRVIGDAATPIPQDSVVSLEDTGSRWRSTDDAVIGGGGEVEVIFEAEDTGPVVALASSTWVIETPIAGWDSAENDLDADLGRVEERDPSLRARRRRTMVALSDVAEAIRAALVRIEGVTEVQVIENESGVEDSEGRPGKSFEAIIRGGDSQEIFDTILAVKPVGIESYGTTSGTALDSLGRPHTIRFTRPTEVPIWVTANIEVDERFPVDGRTLVRAEILAHEDTLITGDDVIRWRIQRDVETDGIQEFEILLGRSLIGQTPENLEIGTREIAVFDTSRITVNRTN